MKFEECMMCKEESPRDEMYVTGWDCEVGRVTEAGWSCNKCMNAHKPIMDLYREYIDVLGRCYMPDHPRFPEEGAKGIEVCKEWQESFWVFLKDVVKLNPAIEENNKTIRR